MEPETVATGAGFRLDRWLRDHFYAGRIDDWMPMILAIEAEARAAAVAPVLEALRDVLETVGYPVHPASCTCPVSAVRNNATALLSAPPLRPSGEPEPGGLDVAWLAELLHQTAPFNHNLGEGPLRAICDSTAAHSPRAQRIIALARLAATPERAAMLGRGFGG